MLTRNDKKLIIYMPAYNEAQTIQQVIQSLPEKIAGISEIEVLVVNDGSEDDTAALARALNATVISHHKNLGLGIAFQNAADYALSANADILISIDADGQFHSKDIPAILAPIQNAEAEMVTGNRFMNGKPENMPWTKYWGNKQVSKILNFLSKSNFQDVSCGFRAYSREALYQLNMFGTYSYTHEVILNLAYKGVPITEVGIDVSYFPERKSRVATSLYKYAYNMGKIILRTMLDYKPLYFFGNLGLLNLFVAMLFIGFMLVNYFISGAFTPYKAFGFIGLGFAVFGTLILFIGLVADMLNRIRMNQDRILYRIKKDKNSTSKRP